MLFQDIISPINVDTFLSEKLGKEPILFKSNNPEKLKSLLDWEDINNIILEQRLEHPRLRMFKNVNLVPDTKYMVKKNSMRGSVNPIITVREFNNAILDGATLIIDAIQEIHRPIRDLCNSFNANLKSVCQANCYIALADQQAFDTHWDGHDVFVLQVRGKKHWSIYHPTRLHPLPLDLDRFDISDIQDNQKRLFWEGVLEEGDVLYVPRGWWHTVSPIGMETVHLSIGYNSPTGIDFMNWVSKRMYDDVLFRKPAPIFQSQEQKQEYINDIKNAIEKTILANSLDDFFDEKLSTTIKRVKPALPYSADKNIEILDENLELKSTLDFFTIQRNNETFFISVHNKRYEFNIEFMPFAEFVLSSNENSFSVNDIINKNFCDKETTNGFLIQLMRLGLIALA